MKDLRIIPINERSEITMVFGDDVTNKQITDAFNRLLSNMREYMSASLELYEREGGYTKSIRHLPNPKHLYNTLEYNNKIHEAMEVEKDPKNKKALEIWNLGRLRWATMDEMAKEFGVSRENFSRRINKLKKIYKLGGKTVTPQREKTDSATNSEET